MRTAEREGLLADIIANPADDFPRLVFADWCEENRLPGIAAYVRERLKVPGESLDVMPPVGCVRAVARRGFIEYVNLPLAAALEHLPRLVREHPLTRVELSDREPRDFSTEEGEAWYEWYRMDCPADPMPYDIPGAVWDRVECAEEGRATHWKAFRAREAAVAALSDALLLWARGVTPPACAGTRP